MHARHSVYKCKQCVAGPLLVFTCLSRKEVNSCWGNALWMEAIWWVLAPLLQTHETLKVQNAVTVNSCSLPELQVPLVSWRTSYWRKKPLLFRCHCSHRFHEQLLLETMSVSGNKVVTPSSSAPFKDVQILMVGQSLSKEKWCWFWLSVDGQTFLSIVQLPVSCPCSISPIKVSGSPGCTWVE